MPTAFISSEICKQLQAAENKVIENPGTKVTQTAENKMSFYSSWGVGQSLDLRPDITGIGGSVESADYNGGTEIMSGTSMASPYVAGASAVVRQYLKEQGIEVSGAELTRYVRILMMNSAIPFEEDGLFVSPRQQGAGLVSLERLMQTKAILTGAENDAKVNLYDRIGDTFSFDVTLKNLSSEVVSFSDAKLCLTTDDTAVSEKSGLHVISGQRVLNCTADLSGLTAVKPGDSLTVTVRVSLDPAQTSDISKAFTNGFFIDGFLMLSGAENSADISIPICGYYGDCTQIPIYSTDTLMLQSNAEGGSSFLALPLREALPIIETILSRATQEEIDNALEYNSLGFLIYKYWTKEEDHLLEQGHGDAWLSPNGDGMHDILNGYGFEIKRQAMAHYSIQNDAGSILFEDETKLNPPMNEPGTFIMEKPIAGLSIRGFDFTSLPEGDYKVSTDMWINYRDAEKHPQNLEIPFKVDNTAPELSCSVEQDGEKTYLNISAHDSGELDCVFLTANCVDESRKQTGITAQHELYMFGVYSGGQSGNDGTPRTEPLPYVLSLMAPKGSPEDHIYDYSEMIPAEQNGSVDVRYDITGLTGVTVTALDRAWNYSVFNAVAGEETVLMDGIWLDQYHGYMEVSGNTIRYADFFDGSVTTYTYTIRDNVLTMTSPEKTIVRQVNFLDPKRIEYRQDDSDALGKMFYNNDEWFTKLEDRPFYTVLEAYPLMKARFEKISGLHVTGYTYEEEYPIDCTFTFETEEDAGNGERMFSADLFAGIAYEEWTRRYDLFSTPLQEIEPGIYFCEGETYYLVFHEDHQTGKVLIAESDSLKQMYEYENLDFTYTIEDGETIILQIGGEEHEGHVSLSDQGLLNLFVSLFGTCRYTRKDYDLSLAENFHSKSQTEKLIAQYHEAVSGQKNAVIGGGFSFDGEIMYSCEGNLLYFIDPFTLKGHDENGHEIDFTNPPSLPEDAKSLDTLKEWALKDYSDKTGRTDGDAAARVNPDETVEISIYLPDSAYDSEREYEDPFRETRYFVDPVTAKGTDQDQNPIDLPQTGSNDPGAMAGAGLALMLILGGGEFCRLGRKRR